MDRINGADTIDIGGGRRGFIDEDLGVGQVGTEVTALWLNMTQEEMIKVIEVAGLVLNPADWTQLWQALQILGLSASARSRRWTAVISITLSSAPGSPAAGDTYLVPTGATGIWAAQVGKIAEWNGTSWSYVTTAEGHGVSLPDGRVFAKIAGVYTELTATEARRGLIKLASLAATIAGLDADTAVTPANLKSLLAAPAVGRPANFKITRTATRSLAAGIMPTVFTASVTKQTADSILVITGLVTILNRTTGAGTWVAEVTVNGQTIRTGIYGNQISAGGSGCYPLYAAFTAIPAGTHTITVKVGRSASATMDLVVNPNSTDETAYGSVTESILSTYEVL